MPQIKLSLHHPKPGQFGHPTVPSLPVSLGVLQSVPAGMEKSRLVPGNYSQAWPRGAQI